MRTLALGDLTNLTEARPGGNLLWVSFDVSGSLGGINFDDEDVLEFDAVGSSWNLFYDASAQHADWPAGADLDAVVIAVPEPAEWLMLVAGGGLLGVLSRARRRRARQTY